MTGNEMSRTRFPAMLEAAERGGPQRIVFHGRLNAMIISPEDWAAIREAAKNAVAADADDDIVFPTIDQIGIRPADMPSDSGEP